jgi:hypothetical protein
MALMPGLHPVSLRPGRPPGRATRTTRTHNRIPHPKRPRHTAAYSCRVGCPGELPGYPILTTRREISISAASWSPSKVSLAITTLDSQRGLPGPTHVSYPESRLPSTLLGSRLSYPEA